MYCSIFKKIQKIMTKIEIVEAYLKSILFVVETMGLLGLKNNRALVWMNENFVVKKRP